jgi:acyl-coenzyme A synthetase/AMP-(fatty) acid ligase
MPGLTANFGFSTACGTLIGGRTVYFADSPYQAIRMIELFSIDFAVAASEQLLAMTRVARKSGAHLRSLRAVMTGGSMLTRALLEAAMAHVCRDIICRYGATEIGAIAQASAHEVLLNPGLAGHLLPGIEVRIFDQNGERLPHDRAGTIKIREAGSGGPWADLGDVGWLTRDNRLYMTGRVADADIAAGNAAAPVSPVHEVEHLLRLEWDATDAAAVMVDDAGGAQIWIGVVDNKGATAEKLAAIARQRGIDNAIRILDVQSIPRGASGKVNRNELKTLLRTS